MFFKQSVSQSVQSFCYVFVNTGACYDDFVRIKKCNNLLHPDFAQLGVACLGFIVFVVPPTLLLLID